MRISWNYRNRRHTAMVMVLIWLFVLASGVVNACALQISGTHGHVQVNQTDAIAPFSEPIEITAVHVGVVASHDEDSDPSPPPCQKACDEGAHLLVAKAPTGLDLTDTGCAPFATTNWIQYPGFNDEPRRAVNARPPPLHRSARRTLQQA
jgi:hypothetical protein